MFRDSSALIADLLPSYVELVKGIRFSCTVGNSNNLSITGAGKVHSSVRLNVARLAINSLQDRKCSLFSTSNSGAGQRNAIERPKWLEADYIKDSDIEFVHGFKEGQGGNKGRRLMTRKLERKDYARFVADTIYKRLCRILVRSRRRSCEVFLASIGYCFVDWSLFPIPTKYGDVTVDQRTLSFTFPASLPDCLVNLSMEDLPTTAICFTGSSNEGLQNSLKLFRGSERGGMSAESSHRKGRK